MSFKLVVDQPPPGTSTVPHPFAVAIPEGRGQIWSANPTLGVEQLSASVRGSGKEKCDMSQGREGWGTQNSDPDHLMTSQLRRMLSSRKDPPQRSPQFLNACALISWKSNDKWRFVGACVPCSKWFQFLVHGLPFSIKITREILSPFGEKWNMNTRGKSQVIGILITVD